MVVSKFFESFEPIRGRIDFVIGGHERMLNRQPNILFVIDDENMGLMACGACRWLSGWFRVGGRHGLCRRGNGCHYFRMVGPEHTTLIKTLLTTEKSGCS